MTENTDDTWDELESKHREETEHTDRANEEGSAFHDIVARQYERFEDDDLNATVSAYDRHTAVLLAALEESGELERVLEALQEDIEMETNGSATKSQLLVAATRYAVADVDDQLLEEAREGYAATQNKPF